MKVCAFTQGENIPSARFRVRQYIPELRNKGIYIDEYKSTFNSSPPKNKIIRPMWGISTLTKRSIDIFKSYNYDATIIQKPFISKYVTIERFAKSKKILDVDDAIWTINGNLSSKLGKYVDCVICGNEFIANEYDKWNNNIEIVPTAVDINRFIPIDRNKNNNDLIIGWSGSSSGLKYVYMIENELNYILDKYPYVKLRIVSNEEPRFKQIRNNRYEYIKWSIDNEANTIQTMDIGIMPLEDTIYERGKCSYKMLLYMACGVPVIVSPVGMNVGVLNLGNVGYSAKNKNEWIYAMEDLIEYQSKRKIMGINGRNIVVNSFSIETISEKIKNIIIKNNK